MTAAISRHTYLGEAPIELTKTYVRISMHGNRLHILFSKLYNKEDYVLISKQKRPIKVKAMCQAGYYSNPEMAYERYKV